MTLAAVWGVVLAASVLNVLWVRAVWRWRRRLVWAAAIFAAAQCVIAWRVLTLGAGETAAGWMVGAGVAALVWSFVLVPLALLAFVVGSVAAWRTRRHQRQ